MNEFEKENGTQNQNAIDGQPLPQAEEIKEEAIAPEEEIPSPPEEPEARTYPPHAPEGWQPYDPNRRYANNWQSGTNTKRKGKKVLIFAIVAAAMVLFLTVLLAATLLLKDLKLPEIPGFDDISSSIGSNDTSKNDPSKGETSLIPTDNPELDLNITDYDKVSTVYTELYDKCSVSCVSIICTYNKTSGYSLGSGFVLSADGYIATNHHVIEDADHITVQFYDGREYEATLIGSDSATDLAVLRIEAKNLVPAELGDSSKVSVGEPVVAIGTPYDISLAGTMTSGVVSGLARDVECTDDYGNVVKTMTLIQTDASINPGNSGGPLFNINGQVIGINTLKLMNEYEGIGFSIPISDATQVFELLVKYGHLPDDSDTDFVKTSPKLHISVMSVSDARNSVEYGRFISSDAPDGVYVIEVTPGTAIYEAGLEIYDIITEFNGKTLKSKEDLATELAKCSAGQQVTVKVYHRGEYKTLTFKLDKAA